MHIHVTYEVDPFVRGTVSGICPSCTAPVRLERHLFVGKLYGSMAVVQRGEVLECPDCHQRCQRTGWFLRLLMGALFLAFIGVLLTGGFFASRALFTMLRDPGDAPALLWLMFAVGFGVGGAAIWKFVRSLRRLWRERFVAVNERLETRF